jgi:octopine/nopaline transport system permease protein
MDLMIESFPRLLNATKLTIELTLLSLIFGIFVGVFFAILRTSKNKIFYNISYYYSYIFRGTPLLVQIFIIYFGLAQVEWIRESFLWIFLKEPYSCAIFAFTLNTGAYSSEIFRSAFETINKGIVEAAEGLGLSRINIFLKIKLPLAIKQSLPAYGNEMILMLKGTSLASTVTLLDLTGVAKHIISTTFRPVEVFIVAGSIYLLMTFIIHNFIKFLEKRYDYESSK